MINATFNTILDLIKAFPNEQSCINHLEKLRWNGEVVSPFDPSSKVYVCAGNKYKCKNTGKYFNVKTATLFDNTKIELQKWFLAIWLITTHKKGISSVQLATDLGVTQKTAWFMNHRIRKCYGIEDDSMMDGMVEVDETYVGGKNSNKSKSKRKLLHADGPQTGANHRVPVLGILSRTGNVVCEVLEKAHKGTIQPILFDKIARTASVVTDGFGAYAGIGHVFAEHVIVNHAQDQYVIGEYHTNTIEGFWSLLKRGILGIYHSVSPKHLQVYTNEFAFRYNTRNNKVQDRFDMVLNNLENRLTYKELTK